MNKPKKAVSRIADAANKANKNTRKQARLLAKKVKSQGSSSASGRSVSTYTNLASKRKSKKDVKTRAKAQYLATLPKSRVKRILYRMHPKRAAAFLFSKEGAIATLKVAGIGFVVLFFLTLVVFAYFRKDLPNPRDVSNRLLNQTTKFYDRTGEHLLYEVYGDQNRTIVEFDKISDYAKWATVAVEDKDFYNHGGFSVSGILRAAWSNVRGGGEVTQGGSTITQQFIKNSLLTNEQTITRKAKELILSIELERLYTKDEILSFYLNEIPYGSLEYGIEAAAQSFFGVPAKKLSIAQAALLAALPQAPSYYSPYGENKQELIERQQLIIDLMAEQGYITPEEAAKAKEVKILKKLIPSEQRSLYTNIEAPHFVLSTQEMLEERYTPQLVRNGGLKVITTLDYDLQKVAEKAVTENMDAVEAGNGDNAALVSTDVATGQVTAMVGSRDFKYPKYGSYNAALADRQPGSSFKPFGYSQLFTSNRWGPDSFIYDTPTTFGDYAPKNFDFGYRGKMKVRQALGESRNIPAVKALYIAGLQDTIDLAKAMGDKSLGDAEQYGLSLVLGAGEVKLAEHTHAYATFARGGKQKEQTYVLKVENADGEVLEEWKDSDGEQVLDPQIAWLMTNVLTDDQARSGTFGLNNPNLLVPGITMGVKTGTTDASVDGWMMGITRYMSTGVWVGNHDNTPMNSITSNQTGPIYTQFMRDAYALKKYEDKPIFDSRPEGIQEVAMDANTGWAAGSKTKSKYIGLFPSWYKKETSDTTSKYIIDKVSGLKATSCTPELAREEKVGGGLWPELLPDDPWFGSWSASAGYSASGAGGGPTKEDNVHKCSDDKPDVSINVSEVSSGVYDIRADVTSGTHPLKTVNFKIDGQTVSSKSVSSSGTYTYRHTFNSSGSKQITVQVIDKVLYDNSASRSVSVSGSSSSFSLSSSPSGGDNVNLQWSSVSGASSYKIYFRKNGGSLQVLNRNSTSYTGDLGGSDGDDFEVYIRSSNNKTSNTVNFEL